MLARHDGGPLVGAQILVAPKLAILQRWGTPSSRSTDSGTEMKPKVAKVQRSTRDTVCSMIVSMDATQSVNVAPRLMSETEFIANLPGSANATVLGRRDRAVFGVAREGKLYYPSFLADPTLRRRQLFAVARLLNGLDNFTKCVFFVTGKGSLGGITPLEALRQGKFRQVKVTAEGFAER